MNTRVFEITHLRHEDDIDPDVVYVTSDSEPSLRDVSYLLDGVDDPDLVTIAELNISTHLA